MRGMWKAMALVGALAIGTPGAAGAQVRELDAGWWNWAAPASTGGQEVSTGRGVVVIPQPRGGRGVDTGTRGGGKVQGNGPPFCRNGEGHPKHGRRWCVDKGWGLGSRQSDRWERRRWEDIVLGTPRRRSATLDQGTLIDVLGEVVFGRVQDQQRRLGTAGPIVGRWTDADVPGGRVLQVRSGMTPLVELSDLDGDGRIDLVLVYRGD